MTKEDYNLLIDLMCNDLIQDEIIGLTHRANSTEKNIKAVERQLKKPSKV